MSIRHLWDTKSVLVRHLTDIVMHKDDAYIDFNAVKGKE
jgi:hypothetical protein